MPQSVEQNLADFADARFGLFVHFGLYSLLGRGEWALNKEQMPVDEYKQLAERFTASAFDADALAQQAKRAGARYLTFTTMHHDGFALYDSKINPFNTVNTACGRDLVEEVVEACRRHGLRVHLYHSLNHWTASPDAVDALESESAYEQFIEFTHARLEELVRKFNPIDCLWYDGWWPFNADRWRAERMNEMARSIQPHLIFNGRNGLPGDFATPEQHLTPPAPWRPWEACVTHNHNWGYHAGDHHFKSTAEVIDMLTQVAAGTGNLLFNVGPDGEGRIPEASRRTLDAVGQWLATNGEAFRNTEPFLFNHQTRRAYDRGDFHHSGRYTVSDHTLFIHLHCWPGASFSIGGLEQRAQRCRLLGSDQEVRFTQQGGRVTFAGLPDEPPQPFGGVLALECDAPPSLYLTGGLRVPKVEHPRYDPCPSDLPSTEAEEIPAESSTH
ncbi:MAG: alpha-L-fucosidase [Phycisphaeraceae bacterium]